MAARTESRSDGRADGGESPRSERYGEEHDRGGDDGDVVARDHPRDLDDGDPERPVEGRKGEDDDRCSAKASPTESAMSTT